MQASQNQSRFANHKIAVIHAETSSGRKLRVSYPDYQFLRDNTQAFAGLSGSAIAPLGLGKGRSARSVWGELVTGILACVVLALVLDVLIVVGTRVLTPWLWAQGGRA